MQDRILAPMADTAERRRFQRVKVDLLGRFMLENESEYPCRVENMSPGDVAVIAPVTPRQGERIILYVDHLGRLEGLVHRIHDEGFALVLRSTERKRERLAAKLTWLANRHELNLPEDRRHERLVPANPLSDLILQDGRRLQVRVIDLSLSGAAVTSSIRPEIGVRLTLGTIKGRVVRHLEDGFAIEFATVQERDVLLKNFS